jgi:hypothetical protein
MNGKPGCGLPQPVGSSLAATTSDARPWAVAFIISAELTMRGAFTISGAFISGQNIGSFSRHANERV